MASENERRLRIKYERENQRSNLSTKFAIGVVSTAAAVTALSTGNYLVGAVIAGGTLLGAWKTANENKVHTAKIDGLQSELERRQAIGEVVGLIGSPPSGSTP